MRKRQPFFILILGLIILSCNAQKIRHKDSSVLNETNENVHIDDDGIELTTYVEIMPEFPGGTVALMKYLSDYVRYPNEALKDAIEGRVIANFIVNGDGSISDITIVRSLHPLLDAEEVRVINAMPKWSPATQRGKPVGIRFTLPVSFSLNKLERK